MWKNQQSLWSLVDLVFWQLIVMRKGIKAVWSAWRLCDKFYSFLASLRQTLLVVNRFKILFGRPGYNVGPESAPLRTPPSRSFLRKAPLVSCCVGSVTCNLIPSALAACAEEQLGHSPSNCMLKSRIRKMLIKVNIRRKFQLL